ncbi:sulfatase-like hydrolase/transferase [Halovivax limisalsi]|uniref:sulfatase-like hydrolase/transferase n=1 Tax=Halovivax limisalsi TaxID=1453760 RepID=UPI001FFCD0D3|nr:sulfatase-like hydrolase/transferase [Halovivax limisalsi]
MGRNVGTLLKRGLRNPREVPPYLLRRLSESVLGGYGHLYKWLHRPPAQERRIHDFISDHDEFVLIVLDACRFDYFERQVSDYLEGTIERTWSPGSLTPQWGPNVWTDQYSLTYVSSNPIIGDFEYSPRNSDFGYSTYCAADHVERFVDVYNFAWDPDARTVLPEDVTNVALEEAARPEPTRLVVHYMQPHLPFVGENEFSDYVLEYQESTVDGSYSPEEKATFMTENDSITLEEKLHYDITWGEELEYDLTVADSNQRGYQALLRSGIKDEAALRDGYRGNLDAALAAVRTLVQRVDCPVVVTADHGELLGEFGLWDHPEIPHPHLRVVPWYEVDAAMCGTKPNTHSPVERDAERSTSEATENRLRDLGYL